MRYVPASGDFLLRFEELCTRETELELARRIAMQRRPELDKLIERIAEGFPLSELESFHCPRCEAPLCVAFDPESEGTFFGVSCSEDVRHAHRLAMTKTPPEWWRQKTSEWLELY